MLAIKEQSKRIIAELLTYGVPPEYLLSVGVSRDILEISFHELHLDLAVPPAPQAVPFFPPLVTSLSAHAAPFTPRASPSPGLTTAPAPPVNPELAALEAEKRQQLLARKAALLARKQQQAHALESDLDALFAAAPSPSSSSPATPKETRSARRNRKKRKLLAAQSVHDLRESVDHTEETVDVPSPGPFVAADYADVQAGPSSRFNSVARSSTQPTSTFVPTSAAGRPKATDLEGEPAHAMSAASLSKGHTAPAYIASASTRMIIELSDDESDEDGEGADEEMRDSSPSTTSNSKLPSPSLAPSEPSRRSSRPPTSDTGQATAAAAAAEAAARAAKAELDERERKLRLEAKEREIQRMMERIAEMERRKQEAKAKTGESASPVPQPPMHAVVANGHAATASDGADRTAALQMQPASAAQSARGTPDVAPASAPARAPARAPAPPAPASEVRTFAEEVPSLSLSRPPCPPDFLTSSVLRFFGKSRAPRPSTHLVQPVDVLSRRLAIPLTLLVRSSSALTSPPSPAIRFVALLLHLRPPRCRPRRPPRLLTFQHPLPGQVRQGSLLGLPASAGWIRLGDCARPRLEEDGVTIPSASRCTCRPLFPRVRLTVRCPLVIASMHDARLLACASSLILPRLPICSEAEVAEYEALERPTAPTAASNAAQ